jgi:hypothetical protein
MRGVGSVMSSLEFGKETVLAYFRILFRTKAGFSEGSHENSGYPVPV